MCKGTGARFRHATTMFHLHMSHTNGQIRQKANECVQSAQPWTSTRLRLRVDNSAQNWFGRKGKRDGQRADYCREVVYRQTNGQATHEWISMSVCSCVCLCAQKGGYRWRGAEATFPLNFGHICVISQLVAGHLLLSVEGNRVL